MPGIVGLISSKPAEHCQRVVRAMTASMMHQPHYVSGVESVPEVGVYAAWVAHDQTSAAKHVLSDKNSAVTVLISGECSRDRDRQSESRSQESASSPATLQWLIELYDNDPDFIGRLNGLFSGILVDKRKRTAYLFNDRYGSERIYWHRTSDEFYFATEAKALLRVVPELRSFDPDGIAQYLAFGCTLNWKTIFRGVQILPGGSLWSFAHGIWKERQYFDPKSFEALPVIPEGTFKADFEAAFKRILPGYFHSDPPLGIALTGGLDTRMIMACRPPSAAEIISYTFTGETGETRDDQIARRVASVCGIDHQLLRLGPDFFSNFAEHADETIYVTDGCFGITGAHEIYLNRQARQLAPIRLTGLVGSEILRGISTFKPSGLPEELIKPDFRERVAASTQIFLSEKTHPVTYAAFRNVPWNLFGSMAASRSQVVLRTPYLDNEIVHLAYQAPPSLRTSPQTAASVISNNNPLLAKIPTDRRLEDRDAGFPRNIARLALETGFKLDYYRNEGMPHWAARFDGIIDAIDSRVRIFGRHKFLHYRRWFAERLAPYVTDILTDPGTRRIPFWNTDFLERAGRAHVQRRGNYVIAINTVLTLEAVERLLLHDVPRQTQIESAVPESAGMADLPR